jgi:hypothetical protein
MKFLPGVCDLSLFSRLPGTLDVYYVSLTPEIVYQASGRTMTDRTHQVGIS